RRRPRTVWPFRAGPLFSRVRGPAESWTTWPVGQASIAAWMPADASDAPFPYVEALTVAQTVVRAGIPPDRPGFHVVARSGGSRSAAAGRTCRKTVRAATIAVRTMRTTRTKRTLDHTGVQARPGSMRHGATELEPHVQM